MPKIALSPSQKSAEMRKQMRAETEAACRNLKDRLHKKHLFFRAAETLQMNVCTLRNHLNTGNISVYEMGVLERFLSEENA